MEGNTADEHVRMFGFWILCAPLRDDSEMNLNLALLTRLR